MKQGNYITLQVCKKYRKYEGKKKIYRSDLADRNMRECGTIWQTE
jgi:hypothetical protein